MQVVEQLADYIYYIYYGTMEPLVRLLTVKDTKITLSVLDATSSTFCASKKPNEREKHTTVKQGGLAQNEAL